MHPAEEVIGAVGLTEMVVRPGDTSVAIGIGLAQLPIHNIQMQESNSGWI